MQLVQTQETMAGLDPTCPVIKNLLLLDAEGKRIAVKYYTPEWCVRPTVFGDMAIGASCCVCGEEQLQGCWRSADPQPG